MRHGWWIRLAGLAPASLIAACLATPAADRLPADHGSASSGTIGAAVAGEQLGSTSAALGGANPGAAVAGEQLGATSAAPGGANPGARPGAPRAGETAGRNAAAVDRTADCLTQLRRLEQAARAGLLTAYDRPPIAVVLVSGAQGWLDARPRQPVDADLPLEVYDAPPPNARCIVRIGPARGQTSAHRTIDLQDVASVYQSGVHRERNPAYDVAERTLRQAKRDARGDNEIISVGDPLLDLIGLAVGGVLNAFDSRSGSNRIEAASAELASIPRSREEPVYRPYAFERYVVRAQKEAVVPVALLDGAGRSLRSTELRQRELRELFMLRGLDPRDRDYQQHRSSSMTPAEFARWQRTPPALRLSSVAVALVGEAQGDPLTGAPVVPPVAPSVPPLGPDLDLPDADPMLDPGPGLEAPELEAPELEGDWQTVALEDADLMAQGAESQSDSLGALRSDPIDADLHELSHAPLPDGRLGAQDLGMPASAQGEARRAGFDLADLKPGIGPPWDARRGDLAASGPHASVVRIEAGYGADAVAGNGFYVREDLVLTAYDVVRDASVVDVTLADGARVPALVASVDPAQGLALVQVPRPGTAVPLYRGSDPPAVRPIGAGAGASGRPLLVDGQVVGMTTQAGGERTGVVAIGAIRAFVDGAASGLPVLP